MNSRRNYVDYVDLIRNYTSRYQLNYILPGKHGLVGEPGANRSARQLPTIIQLAVSMPKQIRKLVH